MKTKSTRKHTGWNIIMLIALIASLFALPAQPTYAASVTLTEKVDPTQSDSPITSTPFVTTSINFIPTAGSSIYFSGCQTTVCSWAIDDYALLTITHSDGSQSTDTFRSDTINKPAINITSLFKPGNNVVQLKLYDSYAPQRGSGALYLFESNIPPGPPNLAIQAIYSWILERFGTFIRNSSDPVNTLTGSFSYVKTDISINGRGPTPIFARSYDSNDPRVGPLGPGWIHNYQMRLVRPTETSNDIAVISPEGRADVFTYNADNYIAPPGIFSTLVKTSAGTYTLTEPNQANWSFDETGRPTRIADQFGNYSTLAYNSSDQLVSVSDPAGRGNITLAYTSGKLTSVTDWIGRSVTYGYDSSGRLSTVTNRENKTTTYGYDGTSSRLTTITDANSHVVVTNTYDSQGRVATQKDARGLTTGQQTTFTYTTNGDGTKTTVVAYPQTSYEPTWNHKEEDTYDTLGRFTKRVTKPVASSTEWITEEYTYDTNSNRDSYKDGRGNITNFCYDTDYSGNAISGSRGNLTRRIDPAPSSGANRPVTLYKYDNKNNLIETIPPKGVASGTSVSCSTNLNSSINTLYATTATFDTATQTKLIATSYSYTDPDLGPKTATTKYEYTDTDNPGLPTKVIPPLGNTTSTPDYTFATSYTYFSTGSKAGLLQTTEPLTGTTTYDYDNIGRRTSVVGPMGNVAGATASQHRWEYTYDNEDQSLLAKVPAPTAGGSQLIVESRYDAVGNKTTIIDANGQVTRYIYDERDQLKYVNQSPNAWTNPSAMATGVITTEYQYDHFGNMSRMIRAKDNSTYERATDYTYDGLNRTRKETQYPNWPSTTTTLQTTFAYDQNSNTTSMTDPLNKTTAYTYDKLNRQTNITYNSTSTPNVTFAYDFNNNRASMVDGTGTTSYSYDEQNRLISATSPGPKVVSYRYDLNGNRRKLIYPDSTAVTYSYDKANRLTSLQDWASRTTTYSFYADGKLKQINHFNGTSAEYTYDNARRLTQVWNKYGTNTITRHTYTIDAAGNRTREDAVLTDGYNPGPITTGRQGYVTYTYDKLYRLTQEYRNLPNPQDEETLSYTYDPVGNRLSKTVADGGIPDVTNFTYDRADRIQAATGDMSETYAVNANGNITRPDAFNNPRLTYDQANRPINSTVSGTYRYTYDGDGKRTKVEYYLTSWSTVNAYVYDVAGRLPNVLVDNTRKYVWGIGLVYIADSNSSAIDNPYVYHTDGSGSVRAMTDNRSPTIRVQMYEEYDSFGVEGYSNRSVGQEFKYAGEQSDGGTGYYYLRARYYDPSIGRFLTRDPVFGKTMDPLTLNRYTYVENNCPNKTDPTGFASSKEAQDCASGNVPEDQIATNVIEPELERLKSLYDKYEKGWFSYQRGITKLTKQSLPSLGDSEKFKGELIEKGFKCIRFESKIWDTSSRGNVLYGYMMRRIGFNLDTALKVGDIDQLTHWESPDPNDDKEQIIAGYFYSK